jgi:starch synthase
MKAAMECANFVSTVSPTYANEIQTPQYAHGLDYEIRRVVSEGKLRGILNGIDKNFYSPSKDNALFEKYDRKSIEKRNINKVKLQEMLNLPVDENIPMIGMVTRLVSHKGLEMVKKAFEELMKEKVQVVVLGTGDAQYEGFFKDMENQYGSKLRAIIAFNQDLSRKIYSASDLFLMPSVSEPCGLSQMIASRYGSVPIVRRTGGLADSICDFTLPGGNGYTFDNIDHNEMLNVIKRALNDFENKETWRKHIEKVMSVDFGWTASAKKYLQMYEEILEK